MDAIKKLKEIGVKDIEQTTHIDPEYVKAILNKDVQKLSELNATKLKGFITIIEREYKVNLDDYKGEFISTSMKMHKEENTNSEGKKEYFLYAHEEEPQNKRVYFIVTLVVVLLIGSYYISSSSSNKVTKKEKEKVIEKNLTSSINDANVDKLLKENSVVLNTIEKKEDINQTKTIDTNATAINSSEEKKVEENLTKKDGKLETIAIESTSKKIWVGIVYLDDFKKIDKIDKNITIDTARDQLIVTGHGRFNLYKNDEVENFKGKKVRFLYKDNNLTIITNKEFKEYNKGKSW